ncbi:MAG TPA: hypothetical protein VF587_12095 [Solirubrobacteraceae bacterium]
MRLGSARGGAAIAAVALSIAAAAPAAQAQTPAAGETSIAASASSMARVVLPGPAVLDGADPNAGSAFTASGGGRYVGWILRPAGASSRDAHALTGHRFGHCFEAGCAPGAVNHVVAAFGYDGETSQDYELPAGTYDLYLITDGVPASVTLKLRGLEGATTVTPEAAVVSSIASPSGSGTGPANFEEGSRMAVGAPGGMVFTGTSVSGQGPGSGQIGSCIYEGGPPSGSGHCDDEENGFKVPLVLPTPDSAATTVPAFLQVGPSDAWAPGGWFTGGMFHWSAGVTSVAVTFATLPPPPGDDGGGPGSDAGGDAAPPAAPGAIVAPGRVVGGPSAPARRTESSSRSGCRPSLRAKRWRRRVTVVVATGEPCRVELRLVRRGRVLASRTVDVAPDQLRIVRLRAPLARKPRLSLVMVATDAGGATTRRTLRVRGR